MWIDYLRKAYVFSLQQCISFKIIMVPLTHSEGLKLDTLCYLSAGQYEFS